MLNFAREMKRIGHDVHLDSTNGYENFPKDLEGNIKCKNCADDKHRDPTKCQLDKNYDLSLSYTIPIHWDEYINRGKRRFSIYNYDGSILPPGWSKFHTFVDRVLPSSTYSKNTLLAARIPEDKLVIVPHCYDSEFIDRKEIYPLNTNRKRKYLTVIQQPHKRKGIDRLLEGWGKAFTKKDDVVLIAKVRTAQKNQSELSFIDELNKLKRRFPNHAPIVVLGGFVDYISDLHRACDVLLSSSHVECFLLPALNNIVSKKITIASGGETGCGNTDFMNENNSLLIKGKAVRMPAEFQYWGKNNKAAMFDPDTDHLAELLRLSNDKHDELLNKFTPGINEVIKKYNAENITKQIIGIYEAIS
jgi:glycosyltransferase involved in cell wall biosynthesis